MPRATFTPRELAELTIEFFRRNYIEGLFLSSAVLVSPDYTTERMLAVLRLLRGEYHFGGYIHAKAIPGTRPELLEQLGFLADHVGTRFDPGRIAAQVVSGIGFIGAGTIIIHRQLVRGLTTAASLWATAGIGLAAGAEMYVVAGAATLLTLFGLEVLTLFFGELGHRRTMIVISAAGRAAIEEKFNRLQCRDYSVVSYEVEASRTPEGGVHRATLVIRSKGTASEEGYIDLLRGNPDITVERIV